MSTKKLLILAAVAVAGYFVYTKFIKKPTAPVVVTTGTTGGGNPNSTQSGLAGVVTDVSHSVSDIANLF